MGNHGDLDEATLPGLGQRRHVALKSRLERLFVLPLRMHGGKRLDAIEREGNLHIHGLLDPQRAVIVECGNTLRRRDEIGAAGRGDAADEMDDGLFRRRIVPGRQWIGLGGSGGRRGGHHGHSEGCDGVHELRLFIAVRPTSELSRFIQARTSREAAVEDC